jgi:hypothetical protein
VGCHQAAQLSDHRRRLILDCAKGQAMTKSNYGLRVAAAAVLALGAAACAGGADPAGGGSGGGGRFVEAFDPTGSALAAAFRRPTREADVRTALAEHVQTATFLQQYAATRQKAGCPASGPCTHRLMLVYVDGRGKPIGDNPSCAQVSADLDRDARGQVAVRGVTWTNRSARCG